MATTTDDLHDATTNALLAILQGRASAYSSGGKSVTKLDLDKLLKLRQELGLLADLESGDIFSVAQFEDPV